MQADLLRLACCRDIGFEYGFRNKIRSSCASRFASLSHERHSGDCFEAFIEGSEQYLGFRV